MFVVFAAVVGVGADRVAEVVEAGAAQHRVQIDHAEHPPLAVEEDVVDLRVVVRHAARDLARFDPLPEAEHLVAAAFDPFDFACHRRTASRGVAREGIVPLPEAETDVVEAGQNVGQRFAVVGQHSLEAADAFAAAAGQFGGRGGLAGHRILDKERRGPIVARRILVIERSVVRGDDGHHFAPRIAAGAAYLLPEKGGYALDVAHHGGDVGEDVAVFALEDVPRTFGRDDVGVVDESFAQRGDRLHGAVETELFGYSFHAVEGLGNRIRELRRSRGLRLRFSRPVG